jgi:hypothetical protein
MSRNIVIVLMYHRHKPLELKTKYPIYTHACARTLCKPQMIDDCGEIDGMKIGRGNPSTCRKPSPAPLCPPQIPHDQTRSRTRAAAVGSQSEPEPYAYMYISLF